MAFIYNNYVLHERYPPVIVACEMTFALLAARF